MRWRRAASCLAAVAGSLALPSVAGATGSAGPMLDDGTALPPSRWSYRAKHGLLRFRLRAKRARVVVQGHC